MAIAAEFKRASPSKGNIALDLVAGEQGSRYASAGAAVLSVLTEPKWFKGSLGDMKEVRLATEGFQVGQKKMRCVCLTPWTRYYIGESLLPQGSSLLSSAI